MNELDKCRHLYSRARIELTRAYKKPFEMDLGDDFQNALFYGTIKSLAERVDTCGFCHTSYGEQNDVKCYDNTHYPRDAAEAARALANCGFLDKAKRIIGFTLRNTPENQYYIPHVLAPDGSIIANTVQVDTPSHVAIAFHRIVELAGPDECLEKQYHRLVRIFDETFAEHFHKPWNLLNAGNYNEQFDGGNNPICDLFTNASFVAGLDAMARVSKYFDANENADRFEERKNILMQGIQKWLYDSQEDIFRIYRDVTTGKATDELNWISLYARRWLPYVGESTWNSIFERLAEISTIDWDGIKIVSGEQKKFSIIGKVFGHLLAYLAGSGRLNMLGDYLEFARRTVRKPVNIYPEWWFYKPDPNPNQYWSGFWKEYSGIWTPYTQDPDGDYTVESGNCEQCGVYCAHMIEDVVGIKVQDGKVAVKPRLPFEFKSVKIGNIPVMPSKTVGYEFMRENNSVVFKVDRAGDFSVRLSLAVPMNAVPHVTLNDAACEKAEVSLLGDVKLVELDLQSATTCETLAVKW